MEDEYGFSIDSTNVLELESDNYVSYTMKINRDTPNNSFVENLLIEIDSTGTPKASIVSYNPTPQWINNFQNNLPQSYEGAITLQPINYNPNSSQTSRMDCIYVLVETTHHCTGIAHDYSGVFDDCWVCGRPSSSQDTWVTSEVLMVSCTNSGGSGGYYSGETGTDSNSSNYNTNNNGGQTASNNQDSSSSDSTSYTGTGMVVTLPDYVMELAYALDIAQPGDTSCFSPAFFDWYNNTYAHLKTEQITDILAFLNQYPDNPEAQEFAMVAMETLENNLIDSIGDIPVVTPPNAADIVNMLECFDLNQDATVTIYVEQPLPGSPTTSYLLNPGHIFVSIEQGTNIAVFGYYPEEGVNPLTGDIEDSGIIADNAGHEYDVSISTSISADQLTDIIAYSIDAPETYNLNTYNCSDFGIEIGNISGLELPDADGTWINGGGSNPGVLGEYIRNLPNSLDYNTNTTSGVAPENNKDC